MLTRVNVQASALPALSQGIFFMHAGDEIMREKINADGTRNHNSYNAPDSVNALRWNRKAQFYDEFTRYQDLLALRQETSLLRIPHANVIAAVHSDLTAFGGHTFASSTVGFRVVRPTAYMDEPYSENVVIHNGDNSGITIDATGYELLFASFGDPQISSTMAVPTSTSIVLGIRR
jgi:pullulanase